MFARAPIAWVMVGMRSWRGTSVAGGGMTGWEDEEGEVATGVVGETGVTGIPTEPSIDIASVMLSKSASPPI